MIYTIKNVIDHPAYQVHEAISWFINHMENFDTFEAALFHDDYPFFIDILTNHDELDNKLTNLLEQYRAIGAANVRTQIITSFNYWNEVQMRCNNIEEDFELWDDLPEIIRITFKNIYDYLYKKVTRKSTALEDLGMLRIQHYRDFWNLNGHVCCFCGIRQLDDPAINLNAYDHYFHTEKYSFCGINYRNIIPMCNKCNQAPSKGDKHMLFSNYENRERRLAFSPYEIIMEPVINIEVDNIFGGDCNVEIEINGGDLAKIETWQQVFNIDERFISEVETNRRHWVGLLVNRNNNILQNVDGLTVEINDHINNINDSQRYLNQHLEHAFWRSVLINIDELDLLLVHLNEVRLARNN